MNVCAYKLNDVWFSIFYFLFSIFQLTPSQVGVLTLLVKFNQLTADFVIVVVVVAAPP